MCTHASGQGRFNVTPTTLVLRPSESSTSLLLKNESAEAIRFQVSAFTWTNAIDGEMKLAPTKDVVFFPALFSIAPGQTRRVRVATSERATTHERAYRLIVEQLPSRAGPRTAGGVEMVTRLNVPLFLEPGIRVAQATLDPVALSNGTLTFDVHNIGTVHVRLDDVVVKGFAREGTMPAHEQRVSGWYRLPGEPRLYRLPLDPRHLPRARVGGGDDDAGGDARPDAGGARGGRCRRVHGTVIPLRSAASNPPRPAGEERAGVRGLIITICLVFVTLQGARAEDVRAIAALIVNGAPQADTTIVWRDGVVWVPATALHDAGVKASETRAVDIDREPHLAPVTLGERVRVERDENDVALRLTLPPELLPKQTIDIPSARPGGGAAHARDRDGVWARAGGSERGGRFVWRFGGCNDRVLSGVLATYPTVTRLGYSLGRGPRVHLLQKHSWFYSNHRNKES